MTGRFYIFLFTCFILVFSIFIESAEAFQGPLYIRNSHPMYVGIGNPVLTSAIIEESMDLNFTYSSIHHVNMSDEWSFEIDMETLITDIRMKKVIDNKLELSLGIPFISYYDGFLDGFLESYHDLFGFDDYGRSYRPKNEFLFEVRHNGEPVIEGKSGQIAIGDIFITAKEILYAKDPAITLNAFLDMPTGDADRGYGNGNYDWGLSLLMDKALGGNFMAYANIGYGFSETFKAKEDIDLHNYLFGGLGIEWAYSGNLSLYSQLFMQESPFEKTGVREIDDDVSILSFGSKHMYKKNVVFEFSFSEDPNTASAPDFMIAFSSSYKF